jgi:hypothetical protein
MSKTQQAMIANAPPDITMTSMARVNRLLTAAADMRQKSPIAGPQRLPRMEESTSGLSAPFLGCPARRIGPFGLQRGAARARRRIFDAPAYSPLAICIIPTAPILRLSAEPHSSETDAKFDAGRSIAEANTPVNSSSG